ncbi:MAG: glucose-6-phosphate dehydrogenase [Thermodesulfovibrionales bacterium]
MKTEIIDSRFLQPCGENTGEAEIRPITMVIFGGSGDLSRRKLIPTLFHLHRKESLAECTVVGFGRHDLDDDGFRRTMKEAISEFGDEPPDDAQWKDFSRRLYFLSGNYEDDAAYRKLLELIERVSIRTEGAFDVIYYMAVPPEVVPGIIEKIRQNRKDNGELREKIVVEKPFGRDRTSSALLNRLLTTAFREEQIYRIDHYLGKETVQNILFLRFSNAIFEQLWNNRHIDHVQITVAEEIGIEHRGSFYEQAGVVRDMVQNHILQLIAMVAMEPPVGFQADFIRDERTKIFRSIRPLEKKYIDSCMIRGQYGRGAINSHDVRGYREEEGVSPASCIPTFFAGKFHVDNLRWAGVPFYVRTGKRLPRRISEICIQLRQMPLRLFGRTCDTMEPNILILTIQPDERISLRFNVQYPHTAGQVHSVEMTLNYMETFKTSPHPSYERQLLDCIKGDLTLFVRQEAVEAMWEIVDPIISRWDESAPGDLSSYAAGSWGPEAAKRLIEQDGRRWITD